MVLLLDPHLATHPIKYRCPTKKSNRITPTCLQYPFRRGWVYQGLSVSVPGGFWEELVKILKASKSNQLHVVAIFWCFFILFQVYSKIPIDVGDSPEQWSGRFSGIHNRFKSWFSQVQPVGYMLTTSSGFPLRNWGIFFRFFQNGR